MYFYGPSSKEGAGAWIVQISTGDEIFFLMYKLEFHTTNNIAEYESLILALRVSKTFNSCLFLVIRVNSSAGEKCLSSKTTIVKGL